MSVEENDVDCRLITWDPLNVFNRRTSDKYAVIVLNRPIRLEKNILLPIWEKAEVKITVDGGTDRWLNYLGDLSGDVVSGKNSVYVPTMITGDMDSISTNAREKLESVGARVIMTENQNLTDYTKALMELAKHCESKNIKLKAIYVIVDTSGRFDHIVGNINTLHKCPKIFDDTQVIQVATDSLTWLLTPGKHRIIIPKTLVDAEGWCGIVPFGNRVDGISTTGLKWNLNGLTMEFGGLISTSNTYDKNCDEVTIDVRENLVWTMGIDAIVDGFHSS